MQLFFYVIFTLIAVILIATASKIYENHYDSLPISKKCSLLSKKPIDYMNAGDAALMADCRYLNLLGKK